MWPNRDKIYWRLRYCLVLEDGCSKYGFVYFLKSKDKVTDCLKNFKNLVENQQDKKIKILRSDNGGEFVNGEFS